MAIPFLDPGSIFGSNNMPPAPGGLMPNANEQLGQPMGGSKFNLGPRQFGSFMPPGLANMLMRMQSINPQAYESVFNADRFSAMPGMRLGQPAMRAFPQFTGGMGNMAPAQPSGGRQRPMGMAMRQAPGDSTSAY